MSSKTYGAGIDMQTVKKSLRIVWRYSLRVPPVDLALLTTDINEQYNRTRSNRGRHVLDPIFRSKKGNFSERRTQPFYLGKTNPLPSNNPTTGYQNCVSTVPARHCNADTKSTSSRSSQPFCGILKLPNSSSTVDPSVPDHLQRHVPNGIRNDCTIPPLFSQRDCNHLRSR